VSKWSGDAGPKPSLTQSSCSTLWSPSSIYQAEPIQPKANTEVPSTMAQSKQRSIVIIGGGIIGCTAAYYLTHHPSFDASNTKVTILEASAHGAA